MFRALLCPSSEDPFAASGYHMNAGVVNRPQPEARPTRQSYGNQRLQRQLEGAPDDGHIGARTMLSGVYATKQ
jgi:hypothetical protein